MVDLDTVMEELKALPPDDIERVVNYIRALNGARGTALHPAFARSFGCLSAEEAEDWLKALEDCERIDGEPPPRFD